MNVLFEALSETYRSLSEINHKLHESDNVEMYANLSLVYAKQLTKEETKIDCMVDAYIRCGEYLTYRGKYQENKTNYENYYNYLAEIYRPGHELILRKADFLTGI